MSRIACITYKYTTIRPVIASVSWYNGKKEYRYYAIVLVTSVLGRVEYQVVNHDLVKTSSGNSMLRD